MTLAYGDPHQIVNLGALRRFQIQTEADIRSLKATLRTTWTKPMASEQRTLMALKKRATMLCSLRALCRGRLHVTSHSEPRKYNLALADAALSRFELRQVSPAAASPVLVTEGAAS